MEAKLDDGPHRIPLGAGNEVGHSVSTCPIKGKPYWYTIMHCAFILVASFFPSIFQH